MSDLQYKFRGTEFKKTVTTHYYLPCRKVDELRYIESFLKILTVHMVGAWKFLSRSDLSSWVVELKIWDLGGVGLCVEVRDSLYLTGVAIGRDKDVCVNCVVSLFAIVVIAVHSDLRNQDATEAHWKRNERSTNDSSNTAKFG